MLYRLSISGLTLPLLFSLASACGGDGNDNPSTVDAAIILPNPEAEPTEFRITQMAILDPHPFATLVQPVDVNDVVNDSITESIEQDTSDPLDDVLDLNIALVFRPLDTTGAGSPMAITFPSCSSPLATTVCTQDSNTEVVDTTATNMASDCLDALPDTTSDYDVNLPIVPVPGPCFVSTAADITVNLGSVTLPLKGAQLAATFPGADPATLNNGLLRGFVTEADADTILIPEDVLLVGGEPLSALLLDEDMDTDPNNGQGWWFYLSFEAGAVEYVHPPTL